jgi:hypothetical protein
VFQNLYKPNSATGTFPEEYGDYRIVNKQSRNPPDNPMLASSLNQDLHRRTWIDSRLTFLARPDGLPRQ